MIWASLAHLNILEVNVAVECIILVYVTTEQLGNVTTVCVSSKINVGSCMVMSVGD